MAAGEYVSVSPQRDAEQQHVCLEQRELSRDPDGELRELAALYERRGLPPVARARGRVDTLASRVLAAHARDELGLDEARPAPPFHAAWMPALSFAAGATLPR
jgi:VIT1/CCC1 family predicted Fe2+/Mn2+ transporter